MNTLIAAFFVSNVLATALIGAKFVSKDDAVFRYFGVAFLLDAVAFAFWTVGYINPTILLPLVTLGAIAFLLSLVFFFHTALMSASANTRRWFTVLGALMVVVVFFIGRYSPSFAYISPEGFLFFNLTPYVQMLYVFALLLAAVPAMNLVASKFNGFYSALVRYGFIAEVAGGVLLITSKDTGALYVAGWVIGIVYLALWVTLLFSRKAWQNVN